MFVAPDVSAEVRRLLLTDAARMGVAIVSLAIGMISLLTQWLRRKSPDRVRLWFGLLALLYGYRTLLMTESAGYFLSARALGFQISLVTFTVGIPAILFAVELVSAK